METCINYTAQDVLSNATDAVARDLRTGAGQEYTEQIVHEKLCAKMSFVGKGECPNLEFDLRAYATFAEAAKDNLKIENRKTFKIETQGVGSSNFGQSLPI